MGERVWRVRVRVRIVVMVRWQVVIIWTGQDVMQEGNRYRKDHVVGVKCVM